MASGYRHSDLTLTGVRSKRLGRLTASPMFAACGALAGSLHDRYLRWLTRSRRIFAGLALVWLFNILDLRFTLLECFSSHFVELNPVAAWFLGGSIGGVVAYKFALVGLGTTIMLCLRKHPVAELGTWLLLGLYVCVIVRWSVYFEFATGHGPATFPPISP